MWWQNPSEGNMKEPTNRLKLSVGEQVYVLSNSKPMLPSLESIFIPLVSPKQYDMNSNKNKGGRPKLPPTEKKKYTLPPVRLGTNDFHVVKTMAKHAGLSLTEYQRQMILHGKVVERLSPEHMDIYRQLAGIGNNQNQLARQANTYGYEQDARLYHENAMEVSNLIKHLLYDGKDN